MNDPSSSSHQKHHRGGGGGTTPATNTTNTTNNNKITPTASHEDLVAQLVRQSPSVMFNSNTNNSIAKTPSQAESTWRACYCIPGGCKRTWPKREVWLKLQSVLKVLLKPWKVNTDLWMGAGTIIKAMRSLGNTQLIHSVSFLHLSHLISFFLWLKIKEIRHHFLHFFLYKRQPPHLLCRRARECCWPCVRRSPPTRPT